MKSVTRRAAPAVLSLIRLHLASLFLAFTGLTAAAAAMAAPPTPAEGAQQGVSALVPRPMAFPKLQLARSLRGNDAVSALGTQLPAVAAWYRMSPQRLADMLRNDTTAWLDRDGRLFFVETRAPTASAAASTQSAPEQAPFPLSQTFYLHSKPGSSRVIYLDFVGATVSGSAWSSSTINAPPYDIDGDPSTFSTTELQYIQLAWQRVSNDYAAFDVDVTTEAPAAGVIERTNSSDQIYGTRAVITDNVFGACNNSCGGIAYVGVFDDSSQHEKYQPAWIFEKANDKDIAEAVSHEVGHNLGLSHDGQTPNTSYYAGHGSGATGWAPIMGVGYYQELTQWSKGEYPNANNTEDDLAIIGANGAKTRADDFPNSFAAGYAGLASLTGTSSGGTFVVDQTGLIESPADSDDFKFSAIAGPASFTAAPMSSPGVDLDVGLTLYDSAGNVIASGNDPDGLSATINVTLPAGDYFLRVVGVGDSDPAPGYSNYGSLGYYRITGSYAVQNPSDTTPDAFSFAAQTNVATSSLRTSGRATITGITAPSPISIVNGTYSIGCNGANFTSAAGTIANNQQVCLRHTASANPGTTVTTTLTVGGVSGNFSSTTATPPSDTTPDAFNFATQSNVPVNTVRTSSRATITGVDGPSPISIANGSYSIGCNGATFTSAAGTIANNQQVCLRHTSSATPGATVTSTLTVGGVTGTFSSTTAVDTTPDAFSFAAQTNVPVSTVRTSGRATITGIDGPSPISVVNGSYSIGCNGANFTSAAGTISNNQAVCLRHTSSSSPGTTVTTTLKIGSVSGTFSSTTASPPSDTTPAAFSFASQAGVPVSTVRTSARATISGINGPSPISITNGSYSIGCNGATFTSAAGTVTNNQQVCVRHTSAATAGTTVTSTLTVGGVSGGFSSTTAP